MGDKFTRKVWFLKCKQSEMVDTQSRHTTEMFTGRVVQSEEREGWKTNPGQCCIQVSTMGTTLIPHEVSTVW